VTGAEVLYGAIAAAAIVLNGALYALCFAIGRVTHSLAWKYSAWAAYAMLVACTYVFASALGLGGGWVIVVAAMLIGYLLAPGAIWHLSAGTHAAGDGGASCDEIVKG
jgi:hypothetical protein